MKQKIVNCVSFFETRLIWKLIFYIKENYIVNIVVNRYLDAVQDINLFKL